jgi:hypothetical protein
MGERVFGEIAFLRAEVGWDGDGAERVPQTDEGEKFDLEVPERCCWCAAGAQAEESAVVFVNVECRNDRQDESESHCEDVHVCFGEHASCCGQHAEWHVNVCGGEVLCVDHFVWGVHRMGNWRQVNVIDCPPNRKKKKRH